MPQQIYFVGTETEIGHHAAPLDGKLNYQVAAPKHVIETAKPGDVAVFYSEHFDRFRHAIVELKQRNIATLYMIDGILEWRNAWENCSDEPACPFAMRPVLSHKVACISESQARTLVQWGNQSKVEVVGVPRFDRFTELQKRPAGSSKHLLVMTAKCPAYTSRQRKLLLQSLRDLKRLIDGQASIQTSWRLTDGLDTEIGVPNSLHDVTGQELVKQLQTVDAVISTPSTAVLESLLFDLPTAILDYNHCPNYVDTAWRISSAEQMKRVLPELFDPPATKMMYQNHQLHWQLNVENATERLQLLISKMREASRLAVENGFELEFANQLLDPPQPPLIAFDHAKIFSNHPEFCQLDLVENQAELAHARREIKHLQLQLDQVRAELGQAHQIFDEINNHPIAGPVVRIRRKLFELFEKLKNKSAQPRPNQS